MIAAKRRVAAAFNQVEEAKAARLPRISLTAGLNWIHSSLFVLKDTSNPGSAVGATLRLPLLTGGALEGEVEARTAEQKRAVAEYAATGPHHRSSALSERVSDDSRFVVGDAAASRRLTVLQRVATLSASFSEPFAWA